MAAVEAEDPQGGDCGNASHPPNHNKVDFGNKLANFFQVVVEYVYSHTLRSLLEERVDQSLGSEECLNVLEDNCLIFYASSQTKKEKDSSLVEAFLTNIRAKTDTEYSSIIRILSVYR